MNLKKCPGCNSIKITKIYKEFEGKQYEIILCSKCSYQHREEI